MRAAPGNAGGRTVALGHVSLRQPTAQQSQQPEWLINRRSLVAPVQQPPGEPRSVGRQRTLDTCTIQPSHHEVLPPYANPNTRKTKDHHPTTAANPAVIPSGSTHPSRPDS